MTNTDYNYPRTYRYSPVAMTAWTSCSLLILLPSLGGLIYCSFMVTKTVWSSAAALAYLVGVPSCLFLAAIGYGALTTTLRGKLVLYADRIEYHGVIATRKIRTEDVKETRKPVRQYGHFNITLTLKNGKSVQITDFGKMDDALAEWIDSFPNNEAKTDAKRSETLLANPAFGNTPEIRKKAINNQVAMLNRLRWLVYAVILWATIHPHPYDICLYIVMAIPAVAAVMVLFSCGKWVLNDDIDSGRIGIGGILAVSPAFVLALRAFLDDDLINWMIPAVVGAAVGLVLTLLMAMIERRFRPTILLPVSIAYICYAWGSLMCLNVTLDESHAVVTQARVLDMSEGQHSDTLNLTRWGSHKDGDEVTVPDQTYRKIHKGDTICVYVYSGTFDWAWYDVDTCPGKP